MYTMAVGGSAMAGWLTTHDAQGVIVGGAIGLLGALVYRSNQDRLVALATERDRLQRMLVAASQAPVEGQGDGVLR
jgi:hypothetical protein